MKFAVQTAGHFWRRLIKLIYNFHQHYLVGNKILTRSIICAGYLFNAIICIFLGGRSKKSATGDDDFLSRKLWLSIAILFTAMAINRLLDLDIRLIDASREIFKTHGWYNHRFTVQVFSLAVITAAGIILFNLMGSTKGSTIDKFLIRGTVFFAAYIIISAISYHPVDRMLAWHLGRLRLGFFLELGSVYLIAFSLLLKFYYLTTNKRRYKTTSIVRYI
jgi:hypothetical protein